VPSLPFLAEPVDQLRARFPQALERVWVAGPDMPDRPGLHRIHVFDHADGLRLLVSRDRFFADEDPKIHVSASWEGAQPATIEAATAQVQAAYEALGGRGRLRWVGQSQARIPHWVIKETDALD
jgi:hypothetical protein